MDVCCDLEVDINGEEVFMVDKKVVSLYSGRINKLFRKSKGLTKSLKVIFNDFPGGAESFELMTRFCYNKGKININPLNVSTLFCIAHFMEMKESVPETPNLLELTEKSLEEIKYWTWSELILALRQCQDLQPVASTSGILGRYFDSLGRRIASSCAEPSPCPSTSSPDSSGFRLSCDTRSTESLKNSSFRATWWFEDFVALDPLLIEMLVKSMLLKNVDHGIISKFLLYYQKSRFAASTTNEKCKVTEAVVQMLHSLDQTLVSFKSLLGLLRVALNLDITKCCRNQLETMIGSLLDQATLDNLLIPSPAGTKYLYDVNLVLRLLKSFIGKGACCLPLTRLRKVAALVDLYIAEVAPDPCLKPSKFLALIKALPDSARVSYDGIYGAIDLYLEVHLGLSEEERMRVCGGLNYEKLSSEVCNHLTKNRKFPSKSAAEALISQKSKLKSLLQETNQPNSFVVPSPSRLAGGKEKAKKDESCQQIVLYAGKLDISTENQRLRAHLQGMQWRVLELEKVCRKMQLQMTKMMKSRLSSQRNAKSLPRLCS